MEPFLRGLPSVIAKELGGRRSEAVEAGAIYSYYGSITHSRQQTNRRMMSLNKSPYVFETTITRIRCVLTGLVWIEGSFKSILIRVDGARAILTTQESKSVRYIFRDVTSSALPQDCLSVVKPDWPERFFKPQLHLVQYIGFSKLKDIKGKENTRHLLHPWLSVAELSVVFEGMVRNSKKRLLLFDHTRRTSLAISFKTLCSIAMWKRHHFNFSRWCKKGGTFLKKMVHQ